eukprot:gene9060-12220_t
MELDGKICRERITIRQLMIVMIEIEYRCIQESWQGIRFNSVTEELILVSLTLDTVNLYDVAEKIIKPRTEDRQCSYVETISVSLQDFRISSVL